MTSRSSRFACFTVVGLLLAMILGHAASGIAAPTSDHPGAEQSTPTPSLGIVPILTPFPQLPTQPALGVHTPTPVPPQPTTVPPTPTATDPGRDPILTPTQPSTLAPIANVTPNPGTGQQTPPPPQVGQVTVTQQVRLCPPTFLNTGALPSSYGPLCTLLPYQVWLGAQPANAGTMSLNIVRQGASRTATLPAGKIELAASSIEGFTAIRTVCQMEGETDVFDAAPGSSRWRAFVTLTPGQFVTCIWYISTSPVATGTLNVTLLQCPAGFTSSKPADYAQTCTAPLDGIRVWEDDILPNDPGGKEPNYTGGSGDAGPGMVSFTTTPAGNYEVFASLLAYGEPVNGATVSASCAGQSFATMPADTAWFPVTVAPGATVSCTLYFSPGRG